MKFIYSFEVWSKHWRYGYFLAFHFAVLTFAVICHDKVAVYDRSLVLVGAKSVYSAMANIS